MRSFVLGLVVGVIGLIISFLGQTAKNPPLFQWGDELEI